MSWVLVNRLAVYWTVSPHREVLEQPTALHHRRNEPTGDCGPGLEAHDRDVAGRGDGQPENHVDGGGLPGSVGAEEGDDLTGLDGQVDPVDCDHRAEGAGDTVELDGRSREVRRWGWVCGFFHGSSVVEQRPSYPPRVSRMHRDKCIGRVAKPTARIVSPHESRDGQQRRARRPAERRLRRRCAGRRVATRRRWHSGDRVDLSARSRLVLTHPRRHPSRAAVPRAGNGPGLSSRRFDRTGVPAASPHLRHREPQQSPVNRGDHPIR